MIATETVFNQQCGELRITHRDKNGNIVNNYTQPIDSHIQQFWNNLAWAYVSGETTSYLNAVNGNNVGGMIPITRNLIAQANGFRGINIGSNGSAVSYNNINITRISFGGGSGQLVADDGSLSFDFATGIGTVSRGFTNTNIATVTVRECALTMSDVVNTGTSSFNIVRDVLSSEIVVALDETLTITYTINFANGTENFARLWGNTFHCRSNTNVSFIDTSNSVFSHNPTSQAGNGGMNAGSGIDNLGIVLGTSNTAVTWGDYALGSPISNGNGSGQLVYATSIVPLQSTLRTTNGTSIYITRFYQNLSGSNITISELGLFGNVNTVSGNYTVMYNRAVVSPPVTVTNNEAVVASWGIRYNFI